MQNRSAVGLLRRDLDSIYVTYWSHHDPLCLSQTLPILRGLAGAGYRLGLVTYESDRWALSEADRRQTRATLAEAGILWFPLRYHKRPRLLAKALDIAAGVRCCAALARKRRAPLLHGRGTIPALIAGCAARLVRARFFNDADSPLSEEYADVGIWPRDGWLHRLVRGVERSMLRHASAVAVLTEARKAQIMRSTSAPVTVIPCSVDVDQFKRNDGARAALRRSLGLEGLIFTYVGKTGGWYATDQMLDFVAAGGGALGEVSLLVATPEDHAAFEIPARRRGIRCIVRTVERTEMAAFLSAADVALSFVLPLPSKTASSPVKNGEYLACSLPIVSTAGIGDYSDLIAARRIGVVVTALQQDAYARALGDLRDLLRDPELGRRCREVAESELSLGRVVLPRYQQIYAGLLGASRRMAQ